MIRAGEEEPSTSQHLPAAIEPMGNLWEGSQKSTTGQVLLKMKMSWDSSPATSFDTNNSTDSLWGLTSPLGEEKTGEN